MSRPAEEGDDVQMAIAALSSMKAASTSSKTKSKPSLPPISSMLNGEQMEGSSSNGTYSEQGYANGTGHHDLQQHHHHRPAAGAGGLQYSYVTANGNSNGHGPHDAGAGNSSTSTSAMTSSTATTPSIRTATSVSSPGTPPFDRERANGGLPLDQEIGDEGFIGRVSQFPLVSGTLKLYERGRNSSRVVKYGTDFMEGTVKTISQPVINRVVGPSLVGQIDNFACRQLDRFGPRTGASPKSGELPLPSNGTEVGPSSSSTARKDGYFPEGEVYYRRPHGKGRAHPDDDTADDGSISPTSEAPTMHSEMSLSTTSTYSYAMTGPPQTQIVRSSPAGRSRWQNLVIEAGVTAGGIGAAVSEESMKSLKYCLHWLHYATAHLDHQVSILRDFILSLSSQHRSNALVRSEDSRAAEILNGIKRDVVETIRKVVDVVSTYAGAALPEQARRYVRSSILGLPERWAQAMQGMPNQQHLADGANGEAVAHAEGSEANVQEPAPMGTTQAAAERTLTFAVESLDMLRGVLNIFNDSVERADAWVERLRLVGLQRQQQALTNNPQRQGRHGLPVRSSPYPAVASPLSSSTSSVTSSASTINGNASTSGVKRREGETDAEDVELHQRRKNSKTSDVRDTVNLEADGTNVMEVDA